LVQSHSGELALLPALPSRWTNGTVSGLCARGGFEVNNLSWTNSRLASATIISKLGRVCRLRLKGPVQVKEGDSVVDVSEVEPGLLQFSTKKEGKYSVTLR
jgi:alpha-L-fucosidase 2